MAAAFGKSEKDEIRSVLRRSAWSHACAEGMKNTSVDQLSAEAGISKGAFYHFYCCKELLFLEVLSGWHQQLFENVEAFMKENSTLAPEELAKVSLKRALHFLLYKPAAKFILTERDILLRRVSPEARQKLYRSDEVIVRKLIDICGVTLNIPIDTAVSMIRLLLVSICHADEIGPGYDDVMEKLIDGVVTQFTGS